MCTFVLMSHVGLLAAEAEACTWLLWSNAVKGREVDVAENKLMNEY